MWRRRRPWVTRPGDRRLPRSPTSRSYRDRESMHRPLRTAALLLGALLATTGCVAVPASPPPAARPPAGLAPAAERPPVPVPADWPSPTQGPPREALDTTEPRPAAASPRPAHRERTDGKPAAARPRRPSAEYRPAARQTSRTTTTRTKRGTPKTASKRATPKTGRTTRAADMRQLCRDAERIHVPYGIPALCRSTYGH